MPPSSLPQEGQSSSSFWRSDPHVLDEYRSTPELPPSADIVIVGAGYAGASTAHHILSLCKSRNLARPSIVLLEAREACSGATGRNGGHLKPDLYGKASTIARSHGIEAGVEIAEFEAKHVWAVKKVVEEENIDCDFVLTRCVDVFLTDDGCAPVKAGVDFLKSNNVSAMDDVYFASGSRAEQLSGVKNAKGCFTYTTAHLYPYKFVMHLLAQAVEAGINLQTQTPVTSVSEVAGSDGLLTVSTPRGDIKTSKIIYATNGYTSALLPEYVDRVIPVRGICSHISPGKVPAPLLQNSYIIRGSGMEVEYLIPRPDGSIVVGGARNKYYSDLNSWYNNVDDANLIEQAKDHFDGYMQKHFHGWEDSGAKTSKVWTGSEFCNPCSSRSVCMLTRYLVMGYTADRQPHIGKIPQRENQYILAGFTGHGMPQIFLAAKGVAEMVLLGAEFKDTGIPRVFETTQARLESTENAIYGEWHDIEEARSV